MSLTVSASCSDGITLTVATLAASFTSSASSVASLAPGFAVFVVVFFYTWRFNKQYSCAA